MDDAPAVPQQGSAGQPSSRRKACDLCVTKKIKCDRLKPVCSNCKLYSTRCSTSLIRRRANPPKPRPRPVEAADASVVNNDTQPLGARVERIERQLEGFLNSSASNHSHGNAAATNHSTGGESSLNSDNLGSDHGSQFHEISLIVPEPIPDALPLPPRDAITPLIDHYFDHRNSAIPIFHRPTFMRMLNDWYQRPTDRDRSTWAAIQITMALGLNTPKPGVVEHEPESMAMANHCLKNAQSAVTELVTLDRGILAIQVLLGIIHIFENCSDPGPASVLIGTAVRLAHRLEMHAAASREFFTPEEIEQRSRVFWITYSFDKDISLRAKIPSFQLDADIDIPLPMPEPADGIGVIWTECGRYSFNFHRMQVELAYIEGKISDLLHSNRSRHLKRDERQRRAAGLGAMLDQWYSRVHPSFRVDAAASTLGPTQLLLMTKLYHCYLLANICTHGVFSQASQWMERINSVDEAAADEFCRYRDNNAPTLVRANLEPPLPSQWDKCLELSRNCMILFQKGLPENVLCCAHFTSLIILLDQMAQYPSHPFVAIDEALTAKSLALYRKARSMVAKRSKIHAIGAAIFELERQAAAAVAAYRSRSEDDVGFSATTDPEMSLFLENQGYHPFGDMAEDPEGPFRFTFGDVLPTED
ncbi:fungal-specific transcription factor domain-containing protein [Stachybotrys elegans]|uniref:Fungal-specific transcription factor domain-containing protein n=1 Tax=Stachybotrys elegans TaxID=80388 RepID=A0A8K0SJI7_9HYPO|nr:fungal-specific transcription factor domain-containing protein [Stachybotrys elegans]